MVDIVASCTHECASLYQGIMYAVVTLVAAVQFFRIRSRCTDWTAQLLFHLFITGFTLIRAAVDLLFAFGVVAAESRIYYFLWSLPGLLFFSTYSLLVMEWARVLHLAHHAPKRQRSSLLPRRGTVLLVANVVIYVGQAAVFVLLFWPSHSGAVGDAFLVAEPTYLAVVSLLSCFAFLFYGCHLYNLFARQLWKSKVQRRMVCHIFTTTIFCTVCFLIRGVTNLTWTRTVDKLHPCQMVGFYIAFYFVVEILPSSAVLLVMRQLPKKVASTDKMLNRLPAHLQITTETSISGPFLGATPGVPAEPSEYDSVQHAALGSMYGLPQTRSDGDSAYYSDGVDYYPRHGDMHAGDRAYY